MLITDESSAPVYTIANGNNGDMPELSEQDSELRAAAIQAAGNAWCPYSRFSVGAVVLTNDGQVFTGCNVENASSGLTVCAERNAIAQAVVAGVRTFKRIVIYTPTDTPTPPCGACRQVISEFASDIRVTSFCDGSDIFDSTIAELLPLGFSMRDSFGN